MGKKKAQEKESSFFQSSAGQSISNSQEESPKKLKKGPTKPRKNNPANTTPKQPKQKKQRKRSDAKLGRPSLEDTSLTVVEDPTSDAQECLLSYLDGIGLKHGLVFRKEDRVKLNAEANSQIKWNADHQWNKEIQLKKITTNEKIYSMITRFAESLDGNLTSEDIVDVFLNLSCLFADECTNQVYTILAQVLESVYYDEEKDEQMKRASKLFAKIIFFSGKFTRVNIKYWIEIPKRKTQMIHGNFINMFCDLALETQKFFTKVKDIKDYLKQERTMQEQLNKIIDNTKANKNKLREADQMVDDVFNQNQ